MVDPGNCSRSISFTAAGSIAPRYGIVSPVSALSGRPGPSPADGDATGADRSDDDAARPPVVPELDRVVIVGASLAGLRACETLRTGGFEGEIVMIGAEVHEPYDRPPLSKKVLHGEWDFERIALRRP